MLEFVKEYFAGVFVSDFWGAYNVLTCAKQKCMAHLLRDLKHVEQYKHTGGDWGPFAERFIRSIKAECLDQMIIFGEKHLRHCIEEFISHYHTERAHQGLDNQIIDQPPQGTGQIVCQERLGGLLKFYSFASF